MIADGMALVNSAFDSLYIFQYLIRINLVLTHALAMG